jgi:hypothetical protein
MLLFSNGKQKTEARGIFFYPFTVCSSCKREFAVCPFVDNGTTEVFCLQMD